MKRSGFANEGRAMGPWSILRLFFCLRQLSLGHRDPGNSEVNDKIDRRSLAGFRVLLVSVDLSNRLLKAKIELQRLVQRELDIEDFCLCRQF